MLPPRPFSGEELVQHSAQHVDVGRRGHRLTPKLFGRRILRRQRAHVRCRLIGQRLLGLQELRDAEVQQLHLADPRDEDVRRLQVAVHDEGLVRVLGGVAHDAEQAQPFFDRQPLPVAMSGDRAPVHVLHDEIGRALGREAGIEQASDVRVREPRQDVRLGLEPRRGGERLRRPAKELQRDLLLVLAIGPFGQIHRSHPAMPDDVDDEPRAEPHADERIAFRLRQRR